jgi:formylglycine-generating enzyme required for sulfatase activity
VGGRAELFLLDSYADFGPPLGVDASFDAAKSIPFSGSADLSPGQYQLRLQGADEQLGVSTVPPLLLLKDQDLIIDLRSPPPEGFVFLPKGPFLNGPGGAVASTPALVYAMKAEVSLALYRQFLKAVALQGASHFRSKEEIEQFGDNVLLVEGPEQFLGLKEELPAHRVSYYEALSFARWYTEVYGGGKHTFRLPTKDEWTKLALGTDGRVHPWGNQVLPPLYKSTDARGFLPVLSFPDRASPYGAHHMEGNVGEWCMDAANASGTRRYVLGKSMAPDSSLWRATTGIGEEATSRLPDVGFRLVGVPVP